MPRRRLASPPAPDPPFFCAERSATSWPGCCMRVLASLTECGSVRRLASVWPAIERAIVRPKVFRRPARRFQSLARTVSAFPEAYPWVRPGQPAEPPRPRGQRTPADAEDLCDIRASAPRTGRLSARECPTPRTQRAGNREIARLNVNFPISLCT